MKKSTIISILTLVAGLILVAVGFAIVRGDFKKLNGKYSDKYTEYTYKCSSKITSIDISELSENVYVSVGDVEFPVIEYWIQDKYEDTVKIKEENGKLKFERGHKNRGWNLVFFNFAFEDTSTRLTIPASFKGEMSIGASSGSVYLDGIELDEKLTAKASSGYVTVKNSTAKELFAKANSGSIKLTNLIISGDVNIQNTSGYLTAEDIVADGDLSAENSSGYLKLVGIRAEEVSAKNTSGGMILEKVEAKEVSASDSSGHLKLESVNADKIEAKNTSGGISLKDISADAITLKCSSGSVSGYISGSEEDYSIITNTGSGSSNLKDSRNGDKTLDVTTSSGSISIKFR